MASVRVTVISSPEAPRTAQPGEQIYSEDPDVNPGAAYGGPTQPTEPPAETAQQQEPPAQDTTPPADTAIVAAPPTEEPGQAVENTPPGDTQQQQTVETQPPVTEPAPQATAADQKQAEDEAIIADAQARAPQKQLFLPPREDPKFAYHPPTEQPEQQATGGQITSVTGETTPPAAGQSENAPLAEAAAPEEIGPAGNRGRCSEASRESKRSGCRQRSPAGSAKARRAETCRQRHANGPGGPGEAQPKPTVKPAARPPVTPKAPVAASAPLPRSDTPGTYFLQLAAYGSEKGAQDLAATLTPTYPTLVVSPQGAGTRCIALSSAR